MEKEELKRNILERINQIDNINILNAIQAILNTLDAERLSHFDPNNHVETEDFSGYIKEWLKSM
ncbi:MAG: hypothetical protein KDC69_02475 [Flavobacteriaceae bacterium]|nr:hypothetical protein [Flavobacteriaceae bacterium]MCB0474508.1 hypothetical protein [Flavobacteriaceae bacterium]